jgi:hypothetical protein
MSQALASARKRRAPPEPVPINRSVQPPVPPPSQPGMNVGLTLPQVIALVDKRLTSLEVAAKDAQSQIHEMGSVAPTQIPSNIAEVLDEYGARFDLIADEIASLKNTILSLQTFTMEVNKTLMQDRIRILSDAPSDLEKALHDA